MIRTTPRRSAWVIRSSRVAGRSDQPMNAPTSATRPTKAAIAFAGEEIPAKVYAEVDGTTVVIDTLIRVRAMPARHLGRVLQLCLDEGALLEFVCLEPCTSESPVDPALGTVFSGWQRVLPGWADNLTDESHAALLEAAQRLNFTRAASWGERQVKAKQFQTPLILMAK